VPRYRGSMRRRNVLGMASPRIGHDLKGATMSTIGTSIFIVSHMT